MNAVDNVKMHLRAKLMAYSKEELIDMVVNMSSAYVQAKLFGGTYVKDRTPSCETKVRTDLEQLLNTTSQRVNLDSIDTSRKV